MTKEKHERESRVDTLNSESNTSTASGNETATASSTVAEKRQKHVEEKDFYWSAFDSDDDFDGFLHIVSCRDGSSLKIELAPLLARLGIDTIKAAIQSVSPATREAGSAEADRLLPDGENKEEQKPRESSGALPDRLRDAENVSAMMLLCYVGSDEDQSEAPIKIAYARRVAKLIASLRADLQKAEASLSSLSAELDGLAEHLVTAVAGVESEPVCDCGVLYRDHSYWEDRVYDVNGYRCPKSVTGSEYCYSATQTARHLQTRQVAAARFILSALLDRSRGTK